MYSILLLSFLASHVLGFNFAFEDVQLTEAETEDYADIRFAGQGDEPPQEECKYLPGDEDWPDDDDWAQFNETLGGALLKPLPPAIVCYDGPHYDATVCANLRRQWAMNTAFHANDPISITSQWSSGYSCVPTADPTSNCTQGGWPVYVVQASTVRHVQLAVNFARNRNLRLVIKNSGHDFNGKTLGRGALSVWPHGLKGLNYLPNYSGPEYTGRAVAYAGGTTSSEASMFAMRNRFSMHTAGGPSVAIAGGYLQAGGHSGSTSWKGLAADQALSIQAVTADGRFVTANKQENPDLFWALRGGGGGNWAIVTSVVSKVWDPVSSAGTSITITTGPQRNSNVTVTSDMFWDGVKEYFAECIKICDAGGLGYNFIRHTTNPISNTPGLIFTTSITLPNKTTTEARAFTRPLLERISALGIPIAIPTIKRSLDPHLHLSLHASTPSSPSPLSPRAPGDLVPSALIASRFFTRTNHASPSALTTMTTAIRSLITSGNLTFHGINHAPTLSAAGGDPNNAVLPAWRTAILHAQGYAGDRHWDGTTIQRSPAEETAQHDVLQGYMQKWRDVTPGSGSYANEGDAQDWDWKAGFYGENYERLLGIKRAYDAWGVFWVIGGVGSD
ncbi:FAD binding domain-containing protein, partial [Polyplosphaeria fusca]